MTPASPYRGIPPPAVSSPAPVSEAGRSDLALMERILALTLGTLFVVLCSIFFEKAGGLWRDEANSVNLAREVSLTQIMRHLDDDSFPLLWLLVLRAWAKLGLVQNDLTVRGLGLLTALCVPVALLLHARFSRISFPFWSFLLLGLNPVFVRCIASTRAYGLGSVLVLLCSAALWQASQTLTWRRGLTAFILALLCVHCIYYNILFVGVMCLGGVLIAWRRRDKKTVAFFVGTFLIGAVSLLPYLPTVERQHSWSMLVSRPVSSLHIWNVLASALGAGGSFFTLLWGMLLLAAIGRALRQRKISPKNTAALSDRSVYALIVLGGSILGYWAFLKVLHYQISAWYYTELMALAAISLDCLLSDPWRKPWRVARLALVGLALAPAFNIARLGVQVRQTGLDLAAARVQAAAHPGDLILVNPWYYGTTFDRYFHSKVVWDTVPPFTSYQYGGMERMKQAMITPDPMGSVRRQIVQTLHRGKCVWLVGDIPFVVAGQKMTILPPAPASPAGWDSKVYQDIWAQQIQICLMQHAATLRVHEISASQQVNILEQPQVEECRGWRASR